MKMKIWRELKECEVNLHIDNTVKPITSLIVEFRSTCVNMLTLESVVLEQYSSKRSAKHWNESLIA